MSDWKFEEILSEELSSDMPDKDFRRRLKQQSIRSLKTRHYAGVWLRRTGVGCSLLLLVIVSFLGGRFSASQPDRIAGNDLRNNTIEVSQDLIPWLRAGLLFTQLGLENRANSAFRMANELASEYRSQGYGLVDIEQNGAHLMLANLSDQRNNEIRWPRAKEPKLALSLHKETPIPFIAQCMGGKNHDE